MSDDRNPSGLETRIEQDDNRLEVVATYRGSEARERVGIHVAKLDDARQQFFLRRATIAAMRKVLRKHRRRMMAQVVGHGPAVKVASE